ncbi:hypothetical protein P280DRAFT_467248 [Massarina eburnea CBS 473.64]|uniref:Rsm22-domain-containing protein n=1 Tax=Massarina eburnea CBS 473.64 TaxID=1395130 RepID=A0A6A6S6D4_9PLEO|nr:hypothetical protein P280DRAFT_467248 [Massarina eburnea CBS 473.64]
MFRGRGVQSICLSCRLNILTARSRTAHARATAQFPRTSTALSRNLSQRRTFVATRRKQEFQEHTNSSAPPDNPPSTLSDGLDIEVNVRKARHTFGDTLPRGHLTEEEYTVYERLYGPPIFLDPAEDVAEGQEEGEELVEQELPDGHKVLLRKNEEGELEEVEAIDEDEEALQEEEEEEEEEEEGHMTEEQREELEEQKVKSYHEEIYATSSARLEDNVDAEENEDEDFLRAHPLTIAGRSKPSPSTVFLPKETLVDPTALLLTRANHKHLAESANQIFGGKGLPYSSSTAPARLGKEQKPIPLGPSHSDMGNIQADAYMASVQPGTYASVMSTLVEVRKRLGSSWIDHLLKMKKGGLVLDAGSGGVGVLAWHEVLKAEWARINEESGATSEGDAPLGKATVLTGSDTLRHRASRLLEDTTFIPRLPDTVPAGEEVNPQQPRKFYDLIIAPHTLWPIRQEYLRKEQVEKYWSLLNPKGGVLILVEKGIPRGFEVVAAARDLLLQNHISSPNSTVIESPVIEQTSKPDVDTRFVKKETGMIIAPCTNHSPCPMYVSPGISLGRKDLCFFSQRFIRPPYLQRILNATDRNHEDVQFSYLAVQRGRDQRLPEHDILGKGIQQNEESTTDALRGHEWKSESELLTSADVNTLTFPRLILPAIKRRGHITLELCTPAGTLERWTVPRSFSKQAYRDARKARWGDLWALGAKTRTARNVRLGRPRDEFDKKGRRIKAPKKNVIVEVGVNEFGEDEGASVKAGGRYNADRKIRGSGGRKGRKKTVDLGKEVGL